MRTAILVRGIVKALLSGTVLAMFDTSHKHTDSLGNTSLTYDKYGPKCTIVVCKSTSLLLLTHINLSTLLMIRHVSLSSVNTNTERS